jgi:putative NADH-flavin reductase
MLLELYLLYAFALNMGLALAAPRARSGTTSSFSRKYKKLLVFGASGGTGREIVRQALARGFQVTAFVRNPSKLGIEHPALTVLQGDVRDAARVASAVQGQDAVLSALGHRAYYALDAPQTHSTRAISRAMEAHAVSRFICVTSLGLGDSAGRLGLVYSLFVLPFVLPLYFWDKAGQERALHASALEWTIVRPGALVNAPARGRLRHGRGVGSYLFTVRIARADVAAFMLDQLASNAYVRQTPGVSW